MPRGDRTGPEGMGPRTGRAMGYCSGAGEPGFLSAPAAGRGMGRGRFAGSGGGFGGAGGGFRRGPGLGWGRYAAAPHWGAWGGSGGWAGPVSPENRRAALEYEKRELEERIRHLERELQAPPDEDSR